MTKYYTTFSHWPENSKEPIHDQALHHPSPLTRKLKRIEPTTKHYTTPPHWPENSKESNPRRSTTPPCQKNHLKYGALNYIDDVTHAHVRVKFKQIAMKNNQLQPFSGVSAISRPFRVLDMAVQNGILTILALTPCIKSTGLKGKVSRINGDS
jgi:hypothetical protein